MNARLNTDFINMKYEMNAKLDTKVNHLAWQEPSYGMQGVHDVTTARDYIIFDNRFQAIERELQSFLLGIENRDYKEKTSMEDIRGNCRWLRLQVTNLKNEMNMKFETKADKDDIINLRTELTTTFTTKVDNMQNELNTALYTKIDNILAPNWGNMTNEMYLDVQDLAAIRAASRRHAALISDL